MEQKKTWRCSSFFLHILAMALMLSDHLWATLFPAQEWMTCIGRIAFPLFAFMIVEGYFHTADFRTYMKRMLLFALLSEIPFDLIYGSTWFYPFHQNVLWTFLLALCLIRLCEKAKAAKAKWLYWLCIPVVCVAGYLLGTITMVDYFGAGVLMVLVFYFFRGRQWWCFLGQLLCLGILNLHTLAGYFYTVSLGSLTIPVAQQGFALLALLPIWLYDGRQGHHSKAFQYFCYGFYPLHLLLLYEIWRLVS